MYYSLFENTILFVLFLCWGSFLNVVGHRIVRDQSIKGRSRCPHCTAQLAWYDLIPLISWIRVQGRCRSCKQPISLLYPFIELFTATIFLLMVWYIEPHYWLAYGIFFSSLIVTIGTDLESLLISRYMTWFLVPVGILLAAFHSLPLSMIESICGTIFGYGILWLIVRLFYRWRKIEGLGQGDLDLMAFIGSFTGILGVWITLLIGSCIGSLIGVLFLIKAKQRFVKIPFGPWLSMGTIIYVFFQKSIMLLIVGF